MDLKLVRIDSRLIHGQVVTKWVKQTGANEIMIIDDELANDEFMLSIYKMAAPSDTPVNVSTVEGITNDWKNGNLDGKRMFVLFKNVETAYRVYQNEFPLTKIQIGGLGSGPGKKKVYGPIYFDEKDITMLTEMNKNNIEVTLQQVPEEASLTLERALKNLK